MYRDDSAKISFMKSVGIFRGPVSVSILDNGSIMIVRPNDEAIIIKDGKVLRRAYNEDGIAWFTNNPDGNPLDRRS